MSILLGQPEKMRSRLFADGSPGSGQPHRLAYVMGTSSRLYDETPINAPAKGRFPALALAKGLAQHIDSMGLLSLEPVRVDVSSTSGDRGWVAKLLEGPFSAVSKQMNAIKR